MHAMPAKSIKKVKYNPHKKKFGISRLLYIIIAIIIAITFIVFSIYRPTIMRPKSKVQPNSSKEIPLFRDDGDLSILRARETVPLEIDIEIADEEPERMRGLMDRMNLPEFAGMLFIFNEEEMRSFWMKNTFISLDIIYINANKEIVSIQKNTQPQTTYSIPSERPARYVLEVNAGFTDKYEINPGDKIEFSY